MTVYNFAAGPAVMPHPVLKQVQEELLDYHGTGMSILEISHRSQAFVDIYQAAKARLLDLMGLDSHEYDALFLQGGGTLQFAMVPMNLARKFHHVAYANTGHWSERAIEEARKVSGVTVDEVTNAGPNYQTIPAIPALSGNTYDYLHITTNNTIYGTSYHNLPQTNIPLVGDLSSNFLGQQYPFNHFALMYAGAQKNLAPAGLTIVVLRKDLIKDDPGLPAMLNYSAIAKKDSALNTPPVFQIYVANLVLAWLQKNGGIAAAENQNKKKAALIYDYLDQSRLFKNPVAPDARSLTNIPFVTGNQNLDQLFVEEADKAGLKNLKGHRSVGGMRASLYNAMPYEGAVALRNFMEKFEAEH